MAWIRPRWAWKPTLNSPTGKLSQPLTETNPGVRARVFLRAATIGWEKFPRCRGMAQEILTMIPSPATFCDEFVSSRAISIGERESHP